MTESVGNPPYAIPLLTRIPLPGPFGYKAA